MKLTFKTLNKVANVIMGQSPSSQTYNVNGQGLPFFQGKTEFGIIYPTTVKWCSEPIKIALPGDILISVRAPVGPTNLSKEECCIGRGLAAIRVRGDLIDRDYLWYFLRASENKLVEKGQGSTFEAINSDDLNSLAIPEVKLVDQRRIAALLKAQLSEVEKARKAVEMQLIETTKLADSIVLESINRTNTRKCRLGDILEEVKTGIGKNWDNYPVLGATRDGLAPAKEPPGKNPQRYKPVFPGTVFYNPMRILIGSIAFVNDDDASGITSPDYVALNGKEGVVDSRWFYYWLRSPLGEQCIRSLARGAVRERMLFNRLAEGEIDLPEYDIQQAASNALAEMTPIRRAVKQKLNEIKLIPRKILAKAFEI